MRRTKKWAVEVKSDLPNGTISEAIQRLAFTFNYKWPGGVGDYTTEVNHNLMIKYLVFDADKKEITYSSNERFLKDVDIEILTELGDLVEYFKHPPLMDVERKVVKEPTKLPKVEFTYHKNKESRTRVILVTDSDDDFIRGFDCNDGYKYKIFRWTQIGLLGAKFLGFETNP